MVAYLIYNDGVIMALDFAAIMGAVLYGLSQQMLIVFVIVVQLANVVGLMSLAWWPSASAASALWWRPSP
jgi:MFS-type transporter involved in bile tolerance (Atg22 family)